MNPALKQAKTNFAHVHENPQIAANAPVAVHEAAEALQRAENAWRADREEAEVNHLAYLAEQRTAIAHAVAQEKIAEEKAQQLAEQRDRILLQARTREAQEAKREAQERARQAEQARSLAHTRALQAQKAQLGEQARAREAELARQEAEQRAKEAELARRRAEDRAQELQQAQEQLAVKVREAEQEREKAQATAKRVDQLEKQLSQFKARETERGLELTLSGVLFEFDKAALKPGALRGLSPLVDFLKSNPDRHVTLEGHTDSVGSDDYNSRLSRRRAEAVEDYLVDRGISGERIDARGLGEQYPVASNDTQAGRLENRRVEIIIAEEPARTAAQADKSTFDRPSRKSAVR